MDLHSYILHQWQIVHMEFSIAVTQKQENNANTIPRIQNYSGVYYRMQMQSLQK